jgi:hypothetical protein
MATLAWAFAAMLLAAQANLAAAQAPLERRPNLAQRHDAWMAALRRSDELPSTMFFARKGITST